MPDDALLAFLRARLTDRERAARYVLSDYAKHEASWYVPSTGVVVLSNGSIVDEMLPTGDGPLAHFIADNDPQFVLDDVAAKRQIIEQYENHQRALDLGGAGILTRYLADELRKVLQAFATVHAGHPDYREDWKP